MIRRGEYRVASRVTLLLGLCMTGCAQDHGAVSLAPLVPNLRAADGHTEFAVAPPAPAVVSKLAADPGLPVAPPEVTPVAVATPAGGVLAGTELPADVPPQVAELPLAVADVPANTPSKVWGILGLNLYPWGDHIASNGVEFHQLFSMDFDFNVMLCQEHRLYLFADSAFWGQKAAPGITNAHQGSFDFSKREFDLSGGVAWNYSGPWEARVFAYSFNNLNRGTSDISPSGFNDGVGLENRFYLGPTYEYLGTAAYDPARSSFLSLGYYPTKSMENTTGRQFSPGPFARAYLTYDLLSEKCYLYGDFQFIASRSFKPSLLNIDAGIAIRPFDCVRRLEFRVGSQNMIDLQNGDGEYSAYVGIRYVF